MPILYPSSNRFKYARSASDFRARRYAIQNPPPPPFDPSLLFAAMEQGAWYDPSDMSTLFQDAAGTTAVTAVEQPVGLMLDKSKGLVLGANIAPETFSTFSSTITNGGAVPSTATSTVNGSYGFVKSLTLTANKYYEFSISWSGNTSGKAIYVGDGSVNLVSSAAVSGVLTGRRFTGATQLYVFIVGGLIGESFTLDNISVRELPGNHARQTTATSRPVLKQDAGGQYYLLCDGIDDGMVTGTITPGTDKAQVITGVRKLSTNVINMVAELSANSDSSAGSFCFAAPVNAKQYYFQIFANTRIDGTVDVGYASPRTDVVTEILDIAGATAADEIKARINGAALTLAYSGTGANTGNFLAYPLYLFRRGGTSFPFNGHFYGGIIRFGDNLPIETIQQTEAWMAAKTGVTL